MTETVVAGLAGHRQRQSAIAVVLGVSAIAVVTWALTSVALDGFGRPMVALALALGLVASNLVPVVNVEGGRLSAFTPVGALLVPLGLLLPVPEAILAYTVGETAGILASHWSSTGLEAPEGNRAARTTMTTAKSVLGAALAIVAMRGIADAMSPAVSQIAAAFVGVAVSSLFDHVVLAFVALYVRGASLRAELVRDLGELLLIGVGEAIVGSMIAVLAGRDQWSLVLGMATFGLLLVSTASLARTAVEHQKADALLLLASDLQDTETVEDVTETLLKAVRRLLPDDDVMICHEEPGDDHRSWPLAANGHPGRSLAVKRIVDTRDYAEQDLELVDAAVSMARVALTRTATQERLAEQDRLRALILSTVAHDLRTPLTSANGAIQTLDRAADRMSAQQVEDMRAVARRSVARALRIVDDLAELQRRGEGEEPPALTDVSAVVADLIGRLELNGVAVELDLQPGRIARIDRVGIERIVENLVLNAAKFSPAGSVITVEVRERSRRTEIVVADEGPGVPEAMRPTIFDAFEQAGSRRGGVGLGLYVAREFTQRHGGRIWVDSSSAGGAAFHVLLPAD